MKSPYLSKEDKDEYRAIFYKSTLTKNMVSEANHVLDNARKVMEMPVPVETPMYFFISDGGEVGVTNWKELLSDYVLQIDFGKYKFLEGGHYVHNEMTDIIAEEMKIFINEVISR